MTDIATRKLDVVTLTAELRVARLRWAELRRTGRSPELEAAYAARIAWLEEYLAKYGGEK